ncbi:Atr-interacting protein [Plakobranchus ocellatus]|uniref:Atr-interacting protein n=1 Tax=Plakobranchus ocellatus TaxID=259542 RepID=A0AAV4DJF4_9GAST|nr:Atr-interacting protein [Plakobranchus ocellatus]
MTHLPAPPLWSLAFFFMLMLLGLDTQFAMVETLLTGMLDTWPQLRAKKTWVILTICIVLFLLGLPLVTEFIFIFAVMDYSRATYGSYVYSDRGEALGWLMVAATVIWMPVCAIYQVAKEKNGGTVSQKIAIQLKPNKQWGPALVEHRKLIDYVPGFVVDPEGEPERQVCLLQSGNFC